MARGPKALLALAALLAPLVAPWAQAVSDEVVRIGVLNEGTGPTAGIGGPGSVVAARLAAAEFGDRVLGRPVEILSADNGTRADLAAATARRWVDSERVDALLDGSVSASALALQEVARERRRIFLATGPAPSDLTGRSCSPFGFHFAPDSYALAAGTGRALAQQGGDTWFFVTADDALGQALERDTTDLLREAGGRVLGAARHSPGAADFSALLQQARASRAKVVGLANAGTDFDKALRQATESGLARDGGQRVAGLLVLVTDIHALGLEATQGLLATTSFYWDRDERTREWNRRFAAAHGGRAATMVQAGTYSALRHYLRAVEAAGTDDAEAVAAMMRRMPVQDMNNRNVEIRADGRVLHDVLLVQAKAPEESIGPWDAYRILARIPGAEAYRPPGQSECPLLRR